MSCRFCGRQLTDTAARILSAGMSDALGQQVIVENIGGAAGMTGTTRVARAAPDGYQLLFGTVDTMAIAPALQKKPPYDSINDFTAAGLAVEQPVALIVRHDLPVNSLSEFAAYAKANHATMQFGSAGVGSGSHFSCYKLNAALGIYLIRRALSQLWPRCAGFAGRTARLTPAPRRNRIRADPERQGQGDHAVDCRSRPPLFPKLTTSKEQGVAGVTPTSGRGSFSRSARPMPSFRSFMTRATGR